MGKHEILRAYEKEFIIPHKFKIAERDTHRPWGAFYKLLDSHTQEFVKLHFHNYTVEELGKGGSLSPKFLMIEPGQRLSWQYHNRRAEIWKVLAGTLLAVTSETDQEGEWKSYEVGDELAFDALVRHRAAAPEGEQWTVVAEIWQHTDPNHPTDEEDIIRLADDYSRAA